MNGTLVGLSIMLIIGMVGITYGLYRDFLFANKMNNIESEKEVRVEG